MIPFFSSVLHASPYVQMDLLPSSTIQSTQLEQEVIHYLSKENTPSLVPWIGFSLDSWSLLATSYYNISEYRSNTAEISSLENIGSLHWEIRGQHSWQTETMQYGIGLGLSHTLAIHNRRSDSFTEEEQEEYDSQSQELKSRIRSIGPNISFFCQYFLRENIALGLGYDAYSLLYWHQTDQVIERKLHFYSQPKLFLSFHL